MIKHPIEPEELMAYLDGELLPDRAASAAAHLEHCRDCQGLAADLQGVSHKLLAWEVAPLNERATARLTAALGERPGAPATSARERWLGGFRLPLKLRWTVWAAGITAAALLVLVPVSYHRTISTASRGVSVDRVATRYPASVPPPAPMQAASQPGSTPIPSGPMIVRTARLVITAGDFDAVRPAIDGILKRNGGYTGEIEVNSPTGLSRSLTATLRVPADHLDAVLAECRKLGRVKSESQGGEDVTSQYVDLDARLTNAHHTEQRLTDLLRDRTGKLSDVLAVEEEIDRVRGEIDRMEAEKKTMLNQVAYATLNLTIAENYQAKLQIVPDSAWTRFRNAAVGGYRTMASSIVGVLLFLIAYGPSVLFWGCVALAARFGWRRLRRSA